MYRFKKLKQEKTWASKTSFGFQPPNDFKTALKPITVAYFLYCFVFLFLTYSTLVPVVAAVDKLWPRPVLVSGRSAPILSLNATAGAPATTLLINTASGLPLLTACLMQHRPLRRLNPAIYWAASVAVPFATEWPVKRREDAAVSPWIFPNWTRERRRDLWVNTVSLR